MKPKTRKFVIAGTIVVLTTLAMRVYAAASGWV